MIGAGKADEAAVAVQKPDLDIIAVIRLGVEVPATDHVLEDNIVGRRGLPLLRGVIDPEH
jgi:hypothetical protein